MTPTDDLPQSVVPDGLNRTALSDFEDSRLAYLKERQSSCQSYNSEMSKWILGSLFLLNAGPFAGLSKENAIYNLALARNAQYFVAALALALTCGFMAWLNTGMREAAFGFEVGQLLAPDGTTSKMDAYRIRSLFFVRFGFAAALVTGFGSLISFTLGAYNLANGFRFCMDAANAHQSVCHR